MFGKLLLLMKSNLDIAYIAGSKQHIGNHNFEATRYRDTSLIVTGTSLKPYCILECNVSDTLM